jgi:hypothetical protein
MLSLMMFLNVFLLLFILCSFMLKNVSRTIEKVVNLHQTTKRTLLYTVVFVYLWNYYYMRLFFFYLVSIAQVIDSCRSIALDGLMITILYSSYQNLQQVIHSNIAPYVSFVVLCYEDLRKSFNPFFFSFRHGSFVSTYLV